MGGWYHPHLNYNDVEMGAFFGAWCSCQERIKESSRTISVWRAALMVPAVPFRDAVRCAGPMTHEHALVWHAESLYTPNEQTELSRLYLVHFGHGVTTHGPSVMEWARNFDLQPSSPASVMALCTQIPFMHRKLVGDPVGIIATDARMYDGVLRACCVWNGSSMNSCALLPFAYPLHDGFWFAFESKKRRAFGGIPDDSDNS